MARPELRHLRIRPRDSSPRRRLRHPPRLPRRLHRRLLRRRLGSLALPLRHAPPHRCSPLHRRLRLRRHRRRRRRRPGLGQGVQRVSPRRLFGLVAQPDRRGKVLARRRWVRCGVQGLCGYSDVDPARLYATRSYPYPVRLLQATDLLQIRDVGGIHGGAGRGLLPLEQRPEHPVLRLRLLQGRRAGASPARLAQALRPQRRRRHLPHRRLRPRLLRLPKRPPIGLRISLRRKPDVEDQTSVGSLLGKVVAQ